MSTEPIFGSWNEMPAHADQLSVLWHHLAAQNVDTPKFQPNSGLSQRRHEITMLWHLYERQKPRVVVEVGVAQGGTFASWCILGRPDATIIGIDRDPNDCRPRPGDQVHPEVVHPMDARARKISRDGGGMYALGRHSQRIHAITGWSYSESTLEELRLLLSGRKIDFLFHDASHSAGMFAKDFPLYWPLIAEGGVFAAQDIQQSRVPECNKRDEWERILSDENYSAVMEFRGSRHDDSMGIGVLIK